MTANGDGSTDPHHGPQPADDECRYCEGPHEGEHCECCDNWLEHEVASIRQRFDHGLFTETFDREDLRHLFNYIYRLQRE